MTHVVPLFDQEMKFEQHLVSSMPLQKPCQKYSYFSGVPVITYYTNSVHNYSRHTACPLRNEHNKRKQALLEVVYTVLANAVYSAYENTSNYHSLTQ